MCKICILQGYKFSNCQTYQRWPIIDTLNLLKMLRSMTAYWKFLGVALDSLVLVFPKSKPRTDANLWAVPLDSSEYLSVEWQYWQDGNGRVIFLSQKLHCTPKYANLWRYLTSFITMWIDVMQLSIAELSQIPNFMHRIDAKSWCIIYPIFTLYSRWLSFVMLS